MSTETRTPNPDDLRIAAEAARWQQSLDGGDEQARARFTAWVKTSPRHLEEFLFMEALEAASDNIDPQRRITVDTSAALKNVVPLHETEAKEPAPAPKARRRKFRSYAVAAGAVLALVVIGSARLFDDPKLYSTAIGEQRSVELEDGSVIQLNTQSRVHVRFSDDRREVRLLEGEALFKVAPDARRPFRVATGDAVIRAVGTQFNVSFRESGTTVAVLEGRVQVEKNRGPDKPKLLAPQILGAGEGARIAGNGKVTREALNVTEVATWRQRRLVFREEALATIAAEFNRYNRSPKIVIEGDTAREARYGGTFDADDPESLAAFVETKGQLSITRTPERILIRGE